MKKYKDDDKRQENNDVSENVVVIMGANEKNKGEKKRGRFSIPTSSSLALLTFFHALSTINISICNRLPSLQSH
jgi:hypothetical protein